MSEHPALVLHFFSGMMRRRHRFVDPLCRLVRGLCETTAAPAFLSFVLISSVSAALLIWACDAQIAALKGTLTEELHATALDGGGGGDGSIEAEPQLFEAGYQFLRARTGKAPTGAPDSIVAAADKIRRLRERKRAQLQAQSCREEREALVASYAGPAEPPGSFDPCEPAQVAVVPELTTPVAFSPEESRREHSAQWEPDGAPITVNP